MRAPYSRIPALPAAIGLAAGIAVAGAGAAVLFSVAAGAVSAVVLWVWRPGRFFASAAAAFCFGILLGDVADKPVAVRYPDARTPLAESIYASPLSGPAAAFAVTTLVADGRYLPQNIRDDFRGAGMAHVLALSGFHAGVVALLAMWLTRPMLLGRSGRRLRVVVVLCAVWGFAWLGGMSASLMRASVMISLLLVSRCIGRYSSPVNSLAVAAIVILLWRPSALYDVGFQLSFAAVAGILAFAGPLNPFDRREWPRMHYAASLAAVPVGATLATAPVVAAVFGAVPLLFLPANVLVAFVFVPFYVLALLLAGLSCMGLHVSLLGAVADALYALMAGGASMLSAPAAVGLDVWGVVAAYVFLALMSLAIKRSRRSFWGTGSDYDSF